jgi:hypothetical protein
VVIPTAGGAACEGGDGPAPGVLRHPAFRVRAGLDRPLNSGGGWQGRTDETVVVGADDPFRVRIEVEAGAGAGEGEPIYGFVYDAGSDGGSGMNRYGAVVLGPSAR